MAYFDPNKQNELVTDASPPGLSAILMQNTPGMKIDKLFHMPVEPSQM